MKAKLHFKFLALLLIPIFYFILIIGFKGKESVIEKVISISDEPVEKDFINLIFTDSYFGRFTPNDPRAIENNINNFKDSLHFNSVHVYGYGNLGGGFDEPIDSYKVYVSRLMNQVSDSGLRGFYGRSKIEQLSYGQRLEYEAEGGNNGFSYTNNTGLVITDSGRQVVRGCLNTAQCPEADATPRYLCQNIYENLQHGDLIDFSQADLYEWHLKPSMRIDTSIFTSTSTTPVVAIVVTNYKGNIVDSIVIRVENFRDDNDEYNGRYINTFTFDQGNPLQISGDTSLGGLNNGMRNDSWEKWKDNCKVDFKVWWFGEVEVWFDKMIVDDRWGNNLFNKDTTIRYSMERRITEESAEFTDIIGDGSFFIDELTHSQIPCVKRVYELMKDTNSNAKLNFATTNYFNVRSYKNNGIGNRELLSQISAESFNADAHEIQHVIPEILDSLDPKIPNAWKYSIPDYTTYLQKQVFGDKSKQTGITPENDTTVWTLSKPSKQGSLVYQIELARQQRDSFAEGTQFIMQPQIHGLLRIDSITNYYEDGIREPLNEEIEAQAMLSISRRCWCSKKFANSDFKIYNTHYANFLVTNNKKAPPSKHSQFYSFKTSI